MDDADAIDEYGVPHEHRHVPMTGKKNKSAVWQFFRELSRPVNRDLTSSKLSNSKSPPKSKAKLNIKYVQPSHQFSANSKMQKGMMCHTLCKLCLDISQAATDSHEDSWRIALCNVRGNSNNAERHLKTSHPDHPQVMLFSKEKEQKRQEDASFALSISAGTTPLEERFHKSRTITFHEKMVKWLAFNNLPHEVTQSPEFIEMIHVFDPTATAVARTTFNDGLETMFNTVYLLFV